MALFSIVGNFAYIRIRKKSKKFSIEEKMNNTKEVKQNSFRMASLTRPISKPIETHRSKKQSQFERPISIKSLIESDVTPPDDEYQKLKELDERFHVLKFSTKVAKKHVVLNKPDGTKTEKHNRLFVYLLINLSIANNIKSLEYRYFYKFLNFLF